MTMYRLTQTLFWMCLLLLLSACDALGGRAAPSATPVVIVKALATIPVTATPNPDEATATRLATTPTPITPTATATLAATPYVGIFIGEAREQDIGEIISAPIYRANPLSAQPTANPNTCEIEIGIDYETIWRQNSIVNQRMGCPIQVAFGFFGDVQVFERGAMYINEETGEIWAIVPDDNLGQYWYVEGTEPVSLEGLTAPEGFLLPEAEFAAVWAGVDGLIEALGFARTEPLRVAMGLQRFEGGTFFLDASIGETFVLIVDGTAYGPFTSPVRNRPE